MSKASEIISSGVPTMTVNRMVERLGEAYSTIINAGQPVRSFPSVMLWGPPGVGKSQGVRQIASMLESRTGRRVSVTDVRLLLFNPIDLRGIPTANADKTLAVWLRPQIFQMDAGEDVINILFLDEISAAPQSVQAAAYQITLDRVVGEHRLPDNCIVIAAGNRVTDKSVAFKMPRALANRLLHIEIEGSFESWRQWAVGAGINEKVLGYLAFRPDALFGFDSAADDLAFATPRSWEMVSSILNTISDDVDEMYPLVAGLVGTGTAVEFRTWSAVWHQLPPVEDIFAGKNPPPPDRSDAMYALVSSMTAYARDHRNNMPLIEHSIEYANRLPADFSVVLLKDYMYLEEGYKERLMKLPVFARWLSTKGRLLNGSV